MKNRTMILRFGLTVLRGIYGIMKIRPVRSKITILSRQSDEPSTDITLLADYMKEEHPDVPVVVMCKRVEGSGSSYGFHMLRQMWHIADSTVILIDGYCIAVSILKHRDETEVIQMWHSSAAIKKFGYQTVDMPGGHSREVAETMCMHRNYDRVLCPSRATGEFFRTAFDVDASKLLLMALPRIDRIMSPESDEDRMRREYGIPAESEILLYAPTLRKAYELDVENMVDALDDGSSTLVICPHPLDVSPALIDERILSRERVVVDRVHSTYDWLDICDGVITDYSAVSVEAAITGKPVYFYVYDIEEYMKNEGLNVDPREEVPEITAEDPGRLAELIGGDYPDDVLKRFRDRYFEADTSGCTAKLGELIYGSAKKINQKIS